VPVALEDVCCMHVLVVPGTEVNSLSVCTPSLYSLAPRTLPFLPFTISSFLASDSSGESEEYRFGA